MHFDFDWGHGEARITQLFDHQFVKQITEGEGQTCGLSEKPKPGRLGTIKSNEG
jgi:hypothetical protein